MAALLTASKRDKDRTALYLHECRTMGLRVLVPDVNRSEVIRAERAQNEAEAKLINRRNEHQ